MSRLYLFRHETVGLEPRTGKAPYGAISAEPYPCKQTTAFVRNANPIQNASHFEDWFVVADAIEKEPADADSFSMAPATGIEPITHP